MIKAIIDFTGYKVDDIAPTAVIIGNSLTTNAGDFPLLTVPGATIKTQAGDYTTILGKPDYAGKTADLAASRKILEKSLHDDGVIVNTRANGDAVLLAKSGYPLTHPAAPHGPLAKGILTGGPTTNNGELSFEISGIKHAKGYIICFTLSSNDEPDPRKWDWQWSPTATGIIKGLLGSTKYKMSAVGLGTDPSLNFSDKIERTTQG